MKKTLSCALAALLLCLAMTGCGVKREPAKPSPTPSVSPKPTASASPEGSVPPSASPLPEITDEMMPDPEDGVVRDEDGVITDEDSGAKREDGGADSGAHNGTSGSTSSSLMPGSRG